MARSVAPEASGIPETHYRAAGAADAQAIARLHAASWRRNYRGAYSDAFLDGDVLADRMSTWSERLRQPDPGRCTILALQGGLVGFSNTYLEHDLAWGALLDNLHVAARHKGHGIGSQLLSLTAAAILERQSRRGLYLWVLERNVDAQTFYRARGGQCVGREPATAPAGIAERLVGSPVRLRFAWSDAAALLPGSRV
jgi:GNAT superfamily N-acetyltransferase